MRERTYLYYRTALHCAELCFEARQVLWVWGFGYDPRPINDEKNQTRRPAGM